MALDLREHVIEETHVNRKGTPPRNVSEGFSFYAMERIGERNGPAELKQRLAVFVIAVLICAAIYAAMALDIQVAN